VLEAKGAGAYAGTNTNSHELPVNRHLIASIASLILLAACAAPAESPHEGWTVPLAASPSAAAGVARVTLLPAGNRTRLELFFTDAGPAPTIPLHVYTYLYEGNCGQLPATAAYDLNDQVLVRTAEGNVAGSRRGPFTLSHRIDLPLDALVNGRYVLALRAAPADGGELLYCANLKRA
jgi:hypothetical protein